MKTKLFISVLAIMALTTLASAQNSSGSSSEPKNSTMKASTFVDTNNNGICDNYEKFAANTTNCRRSGVNNCCGLGRRQMQGQGLGQGQGQGQGNGPGMGRNRSGMGQGYGRGRNFIDADKNGICDNFEAPSRK
jgi:hypothetical protein